MKRQYLTLIGAILLCVLQTSYADYKGQVRESSGKPLAGVMVSNGLDVVKTGKDGRFVLPDFEKAKFVFVTMPSGYKAEKHYIPVADERESYDFVLSRYSFSINKAGEHHFIQITDTEIHNNPDDSVWSEELKKFAGTSKPAFIMHTGDICYENGMKAHIKLLNTGNSPCPVFYGIGNHDLVKGKTGEALFEEIYGPVFYSFDAGNVHYVVTPMLGGDYRPGYTKEDVYKWLKNDLAQTSPRKSLVVFSHDLLTNGDKFVYGPNDKESVDLDAHKLKAWIYGHWHINYMRKQGNVLAICTSSEDKGGIDHSAGAFRVLSIDAKGDISSRLRYPYVRESMEISSLSSGRSMILANGNVPLSVNVYDSASPVKSVQAEFQIAAKKSKPIVLNRKTDWNWTAVLPLGNSNGLEGQKVKIMTKALLEDGRTISREGEFVYSRSKRLAIAPGPHWENLLNNAAHTGMAVDIKEGLPVPLWVSNVSANIFMSSPLISDKLVFVASVDENLKGEAHVYALDLSSGNPVWKYKTRNSVKNTIAADDRHVYAQDVDGWLYAINKKTGKLAWEKELHKPQLPGLVDGLAADKGIVYAGSGRGMGAFDGKNGREIWKNNAWGMNEGTTATLSAGSNVLIGSAQWGALYGHDLSTGKLLWTRKDNGLRNRASSAALHAGKLYILSEKSLFLIDAVSGKIEKKKEFPYGLDTTSTPLVMEKLIVFGSSTDGLIAVDKNTWEEKWKYKTGQSLVFTAPYTRPDAATIETSPVGGAGKVWVAASDGGLYVFSEEDGRLLWQFRSGAPFLSTPALSGNMLVAADYSGNVYAFVLVPQGSE